MLFYKLVIFFLAFNCSVSAESDQEIFLIADENDIVIDGEEKVASNLDLSLHQEVLNDFVNFKKSDLNSYTIKSEQSLMLVSFKIYGTVKMWIVLAKINKDVLNNSYKITRGMVLKYPHAKNTYKRPKGNPYLVKAGDSLSLVSDKVYGNYKKWPVIWKNNLQMINDPNLIYPGFTLFYPKLKKQSSLMSSLY